MTHPNVNHQGINHPSYMEYFKLRSQPFSEHAPRESLWTDSRMEEGLARLQHLVQSGLLGLVTGSSGLGKSALLKRFMGEQSPQHCTPIYCHLAHLPSNGLLKVVLGQLGEVPRRGKDKRPLTKDQTRRYIDFQMSEHGGDVKVFDERLQSGVLAAVAE